MSVYIVWIADYMCWVVLSLALGLVEDLGHAQNTDILASDNILNLLIFIYYFLLQDTRL